MLSSLMPHAECWRPYQRMIWTMAIANAVTSLSFFSICGMLLFLARKTGRAIARDWVFFLVGFALFIAACGATHMMEIVMPWIPFFWMVACTNIITAVLSAYVAFRLIRRANDLGAGINAYAQRLNSAQTEKARVEDSLLAARRLEEWNRMSAVVTHEINNPLAAIQNLMYLIEDNPSASDEIKAVASQAAEEVRRIGTITRSTLGFFRQDLQPERTDIRGSAESVRFLLDPVLRQRGIELEIQCVGDCTVNAYSMETRQVLLNLVFNACEATTHRGARVRIRMEGRRDDVVIEVEDEGVGITPQMLENLFQFGVTTKGARGNGMGLWAVKKLITRHGGTIDVESTVGKGTTFTVRWPRQIPTELLSSNNAISLAPAEA